MFSEKQKKKYLEKITQQIFGQKKMNYEFSIDWYRRITENPGIYTVWEGKVNKLVYVGETGSIRGRMKDMRDTRNHVLRKNIGKEKFGNLKLYEPVSSKKKFSTEIENKINHWFKKEVKIAYLELNFGRKEVEEYLIEKYKPKYNNKTARNKK